MTTTGPWCSVQHGSPSFRCCRRIWWLDRPIVPARSTAPAHLLTCYPVATPCDPAVMRCWSAVLATAPAEAGAERWERAVQRHAAPRSYIAPRPVGEHDKLQSVDHAFNTRQPLALSLESVVDPAEPGHDGDADRDNGDDNGDPFDRHNVLLERPAWSGRLQPLLHSKLRIISEYSGCARLDWRLLTLQ